MYLLWKRIIAHTWSNPLRNYFQNRSWYPNSSKSNFLAKRNSQTPSAGYWKALSSILVSISNLSVTSLIGAPYLQFQHTPHPRTIERRKRWVCHTTFCRFKHMTLMTTLLPYAGGTNSTSLLSEQSRTLNQSSVSAANDYHDRLSLRLLTKIRSETNHGKQTSNERGFGARIKLLSSTSSCI